jgi:hypothetical protein
VHASNEDLEPHRLDKVNTLSKRFRKATIGWQNPELSVLLASIIKSGASPDIVEQLLNNCADSNRLQRGGGQYITTPLSAAIQVKLVNPIPIFELLVAKGMDVHGRDVARLRFPPNQYTFMSSRQRMQWPSMALS